MPSSPQQRRESDPGRGDEPADRPGPPGDGRKRLRIPLWVFLAPIVLLLVIHWASDRRDEISYGKFRRLLIERKLHSVTLTADKVRGEMKGEGEDGQRKTFVAVREAPDEGLIPLLDDRLGENWERETSWLESPVVYWLLPLAFLFILWRFLMGRSGAMGGVMDFRQSRARVAAQRDVGVTFDDVAGIQECKDELMEVVEFLKNPSKFTRLGARIPKGVLLLGPPGTGKTLLARAVAGEAEVTFLSLSGSDFVEMFVGVGAARVRDLFEQAASAAPCIIFIDELDALGKTRGSGMMGGHDEREQTLNALLVQMDGFTAQKGVIILAATNRPEMLDPALLRPGRFDRQITVPPPDLRDRRDILRVHAGNVKLGDDADLNKLAAMTPGFVGADLANLVNEATLLAARRDKEQVGMQEFEDSIERVVAGLEKRSRLMNPEEKNVVAHHEAGHALVASLLPGADPVHKVSMIPRGMAALGYTLQMPEEDRYLLRKSELLDRMAVMLGGRAAEEVVFHEVSTGAQNDLQHATELARDMVTHYGMSEEIGPVAYGMSGAPRTPDELYAGKHWSERTARQIDGAVRALIDSAHERARSLIAGHRDALAALAAALKQREVIEADELREILARHGIKLPERRRREEDESDAPPQNQPAAEPDEEPPPTREPDTEQGAGQTGA